MMRITLACSTLVALGTLTVACNTESGGDGNPFDVDSSTDSGESTSSSTSTTGSTGTTDATTDATSGSGSTSDTSGSTGSGSSGSTSTTGNTSSGALCGDGVISGAEECDCGGETCTADDFGGLACTDLEGPMPGMNFTGGDLDCNPASCQIVTDGCGFCGDGVVNGNEPCETDEDITETCMTLGRGTTGDLACTETCEIDTTSCTFCGFDFEFDAADCPGTWTTGKAAAQSAPSSWACGDPGTYGGGPGNMGPLGMWGTGLDGPYNANESSFIASGPLDLSMCQNEGVELSIEHWHNFEGGITNNDGGIVQVSTDGGQVWTTVIPKAEMTNHQYYDAQSLSATYPPVDGAKGFSGKEGENTWQVSTFDLTSYAGMSDVRVRLVFGSDSSNQLGGWYVDAVRVVGGQ